jgi:type 1 glutamine amidotransferase
VVFNTLREGDLALSVEEQKGIKEFIGSGHGFVCIHISGCVPDSWPGYGDITGGGWVMGQSFHPPYGQFEVNVVDDSHPGAVGISDFTTNDELYMNIEFRDGNDVFISAEFEGGSLPKNRADGETMDMPGGTFPLGWTRKYGSGKVFVTLLGHDGLSFKTPEFQRMILNGIDWATS